MLVLLEKHAAQLQEGGGVVLQIESLGQGLLGRLEVAQKEMADSFVVHHVLKQSDGHLGQRGGNRNLSQQTQSRTPLARIPS